MDTVQEVAIVIPPGPIKTDLGEFAGWHVVCGRDGCPHTFTGATPLKAMTAYAQHLFDAHCSDEDAQRLAEAIEDAEDAED